MDFTNLAGPALYIHIPFCRAKCPYCGFYSVPIAGWDSSRLVDALIKELDQYGLTTPPATIYIGGGSPSCLPPDQLYSLIKQINQRLNSPAEFTIEVNPAQINAEQLRHLRELGVNRLSIGAQSFNENDLKFLQRPYLPAQIRNLVADARHVGFANISLDLIFAVPGSTIDSWRSSLQAAIELDIEHLSAYALTYEKNTPLYDQVQKGQVNPVDEQTDLAMYELTIDLLEQADFEQYEISNFARSGFACRHNLTYWTGLPYIGLGPAAGSFFQGKRTSNIADVARYLEAVDTGRTCFAEVHTPDPVTLACETAVLMLRRRSGINLDLFQKQTGYHALSLFDETIAYYQKLELLGVEPNRIYLTRRGLPIADSILCDFAAP